MYKGTWVQTRARIHRNVVLKEKGFIIILSAVQRCERAACTRAGGIYVYTRPGRRSYCIKSRANHRALACLYYSGTRAETISCEKRKEIWGILRGRRVYRHWHNNVTSSYALELQSAKTRAPLLYTGTLRCTVVMPRYTRAASADITARDHTQVAVHVITRRYINTPKRTTLRVRMTQQPPSTRTAQYSLLMVYPW